MTRISRAPVLSATRSLVSFWINASRSSSPLHHLHQPPALGPRQGPCLPDDHGVPDVRVIALVVGVQGVRGAHDLVVAAVAASHVDAHGDRLVGLVGDDYALTDLLDPRHALARGRGLAARSRRLGLGAGAARGPQLGLLAALGLALLLALLGGALPSRPDPGGLGGAGAPAPFLGRQDLLALGGRSPRTSGRSLGSRFRGVLLFSHSYACAL